ncbi:PhoD-like phosphatase-domain-containing protein [Mycena floridula]|nr:PhoD-like phosphatase-domain-containing protein [Mycena floridula]
MSYPHFVAAFSSTVFRLAAFIYLRVIPTSLGPTVLPLFYLAHLLSSPWLVKPRAAQKEKDEPPVCPPQKQLSLATALFSLPISSTRLRNITVAINSIIFFACLEFTATPYLDTARDLSFTRVGAVYPDSAKIVVRYPAAGNDTKNDVQIFWRQVVADLNETAYPWRDGPLVSLSEEQDWTSTVKLSGLWPSTAYEYALASNRTLLPYPATPISFQTFPDPRLPTGSHFRFVASSCATPNFPYVPFQGRTIKGFDLLANYLSSVKSTAPAEFMLFLGDFIYSDVPFYFGNSKDAYRRLYRRNYQSPSFRKIYERLPVFHIYDDHENDYMGKSNDSNAPFPAASDAYNIYNGAANYDSMSKNQHHYNFQYGDAAFFVLDTRRHRNRELEDPVEHTMLGESQLADLQDWLAKVNSTTTFKFIVSSVPFTSLWSYGQTDTWGGYPKEKAELLNAMHSVPNVVIISGDRHEFAEIAFNGPSHQITEFSTSPLSMFALPFIRTLKRQSEETIDIRNASNEMSTVPRETVKKYLGTGNYKWSSFEVDTRDRARPTLTVEVTIDGHEAYRTEIQGTPVKIQTINAIGALVTTSFKDLFDRIGMQPSRWF